MVGAGVGGKVTPSRVGDVVGRGTSRTQICFLLLLTPCAPLPVKVPNKGFHAMAVTWARPFPLDGMEIWQPGGS